MSFADLRGGGGRGGGGAVGGSFNSPGPVSYQNGGPALSGTSRDFSTLHNSVTNSVFKLNKQVLSITQMSGQLGGKNDTHALRSRLHDLQEDAKMTARHASEDISRLGEIVHSTVTSSSSSSSVSSSSKAVTMERKERQDKLNKVTRDFKSVVHKFELAAKESAKKMRESVARAKEHMAHSSHSSHGQHNSSNDPYSSSVVEERQSLLESNKRQQLLQSENEILFNESIIAEREEGIREVEATVGELAEIFKDLAVLVDDQGQMVDVIDSHVGNAAARTEAAVNELDKANKYQKKSRNKMCCIMIFLLILGLGIALILTKGFQ